MLSTNKLHQKRISVNKDKILGEQLMIVTIIFINTREEIDGPGSYSYLVERKTQKFDIINIILHIY